MERANHLRTLAQRAAIELYRRIHSHETERFEGVREEFLCLVLFCAETRLAAQSPSAEVSESGELFLEMILGEFGSRFGDAYAQRSEAFRAALSGQEGDTPEGLSEALMPLVAGRVIHRLGRPSRQAVEHFLPPIVADIIGRV